ncbi:DMT family transporter [Helicobacter sp.]|uniref:DMT family transporter n=1 Tax=Helicobacter sp. TaxID=218 RepID=UPI0025C3320C|nr:DMT family transporter [Helicobacter sp.]
MGFLFVLLACIFWGTENNCTRVLSKNNPLQIVLLKGIFSGSGSLIIALCIGEKIPQTLWVILSVLLLGFVAYGLSIFFYTYAQRTLGAARTSAYYAITPFIGTGLSFLIFKNAPTYFYFIALIFMIIGAFLSSSDEKLF